MQNLQATKTLAKPQDKEETNKDSNWVKDNLAEGDHGH